MRLKPLGITVVSVRGTQDGPLTLPALTEHAVSILYPGRGLFPEHHHLVIDLTQGQRIQNCDKYVSVAPK